MVAKFEWNFSPILNAFFVCVEVFFLFFTLWNNVTWEVVKKMVARFP